MIASRQLATDANIGQLKQVADSLSFARWQHSFQTSERMPLGVSVVSVSQLLVVSLTTRATVT